MTDFLFDYGLFLAKAITLVVALGFIVAMVAAAKAKDRESPERLEIEQLNDRLDQQREHLAHAIYSPEQFKADRKRQKKKRDARHKASRNGRRCRLFVMDFRGDIAATAVTGLREEITALLQVLEPGDEVLLRLESEGGMVHAYGLAASQLKRLRDRGHRLTVAVDKVAASGGYLMACVADHILAAPFAVVGSIGVVAQLPNVNRLLKKHEVDIELHTAGEFKRTLTVLGENTEAGRQKFREELEDTHNLFKQFVSEHRPQVPLEKAATGEHWFGARAVALKLVDALRTSDDYLLERAETMELYSLRYRRRRPWAERLQRRLLKIWQETPVAGLSEVDAGLKRAPRFML